MNKLERKAQRVLDLAQESLDNGFNSILVHDNAEKELAQLNLRADDLRHYRRLLQMITGVREPK